MNAQASLDTLTGELSRLRVLPVIELPDTECATPLCGALLTAGCTVAEITMRTSAGLAALPALRAAYPEMLIGAGTVRTPDDARRAAEAGAQFIVSPATNSDLLFACQSLGIPAVPGACTPTEADTAARSGASVVKFFPAAPMGGPAALAAFAGPFPDLSFIPTGGIGPGNLGSYLRQPNVLACGGSWLVARALLASRRFDKVEALTREALSIAARAAAEAGHD